MKRSMISSLALAAAMLVSTGAWAQTMVGQQNVSAEDLPKVQAQCNTLSAKAKESLASQSPTDSNASSTDDNSGGDNGGTDDAATTPGGAGEDDGAGDLGTETETPNNPSPGIDLSLITLEDCQAAGLVQ
jgi:hypothetical protein